MVVVRNTDTRLDGLEKVVGNLEKKTETLATMVNKLKIQCIKMDEAVSALGSRLETSMAEMRVALFSGNSKNTTGSIPKDSSDEHGMRNRFADIVARNQPKIPPTSNNNNTDILPSLPTVTATSLSSTPPTTPQQEIPPITTSIIHPVVNTKAPLPFPTNPPTPEMVTAPLQCSSAEIPEFQPPFFPLLRRKVFAAADEQAKLMVRTPLLSASPDILQIQSRNYSMLRYFVHAAAHQSTPTVVSFPGSLFSLAGAPLSYPVMLRFLHIVGHLLWFNALATTRKHEFEPPPDKLIGFNFDLRLEGKAVLRVRQLIQSEIWELLDANKIIGIS